MKTGELLRQVGMIEYLDTTDEMSFVEEFNLADKNPIDALREIDEKLEDKRVYFWHEKLYEGKKGLLNAIREFFDIGEQW